MIEKLVQHINSIIEKPLSSDEIQMLSKIFQFKKIRKHQYFVQAGEVCKIGGFVLKGAMKKYSIDSSGKENVVELYIENWWAGDRESFTTGAPTPYFIDAFEDTELLVISKDHFFDEANKLPFLHEFRRVLTDRQSFKLMKRIHASQTLTAQQKLEELQDTYPAFFQRFPQHIIASYLGMTKETLSRIRGSSLKK